MCVPTPHNPGPVCLKVPSWANDDRGGQVLKNYLNNAENLGTEALWKWFFGNITEWFLGKKHTVSKTQVLFFFVGGERGELWIILGNHLMFSCHYIVLLIRHTAKVDHEAAKHGAW